MSKLNRIFLLVAFGVSVYLAYVALGGSAVAGCGPESGCDKVLQSRWSRWFGIPVSAFSVLAYGALLALTFRLGGKVEPAAQRAAWRWIIPLVVLVIASVLWFAGLQVFVLKQVCPYCMAVHGAGLLASALLLFAAPFRNAPDKPWQAEKQVFLPPATANKMALLGLAAFALFAGGQLLHRPKTFSVQTTGASITEPARTFQIYDGTFTFDLNEVPLMGSPKAPYTIVSLFDYTCHHCRIMHWHLVEAQRALSNQLSVVSLPNPLDNRCNSNVRQTSRAHMEACEYARVGLGVWRANPKAHHQFEDWIFKPEHPPGLPEVFDYANALVGTNELNRALLDEWVPRMMQVGIRVYSTNYLHLKNGNMPQLIIGSRLTGGTFASTAELYKLLAEHLGLKPPSS